MNDGTRIMDYFRLSINVAHNIFGRLKEGKNEHLMMFMLHPFC
jgi:hypothetical protein